MSLSPEYFEATRQNYPAIVAAAKEALAAGYVIQPQRGNKSFLVGWNTLANRPRLDPEKDFRSNNGECFNLGAVIALDPQGDAPNAVVDVDFHGVRDQKDRDDCMAAKQRLLGDLVPTTITGSGGLHFHLRLPAAVVVEFFTAGNVIILAYEGKGEGKPYRRAHGEPQPRWVIELFGIAHSITLPPSIHPHTLKPYRWECGSPHTRPAPDSLIAAVRAERVGPESREWGPLGNLGAAKLPPVLPFDPKLLPEAIRVWAVDEAARMPCALDFVAVAVIVIISSVIGAICTIHPKGKDPWAVAAILWGMLIGPPGDMKSPAMNAAAKALMVLIEEARLKYKEEMLAYSVEKKKYDALMGALEDEMKKAGKSSGDRDAATTRVVEQIVDLETRAPMEPLHRRYETQDATVEKVVDLLCDNHRGIMQRLDEMPRLLFGFERPEHAGDRATYLEGYEALHSKSIDRIKRGERFAPNNCITLLGGAQPDAFAAWADMTTDISRNDGFLPRFGLMVYPDATSWSWVDKPPAPGAYERVLLIFKQLANFDPMAWGAALGERDKFPWFQFSSDAQSVFIQWLTELRSERIPKEDDPLIKQHLSKYDRVFCSLSLVFHLIERADYEVRSRGGIDDEGNVQYGFSSVGNQVSVECARRAAAWLEYLETHMRRCYALLGHSRVRNASVLAAKIARGDLKEGFTKRDIIRHQWAGLKSDDDVRAALDWLEVRGVGPSCPPASRPEWSSYRPLPDPSPDPCRSEGESPCLTGSRTFYGSLIWLLHHKIQRSKPSENPTTLPLFSPSKKEKGSNISDYGYFSLPHLTVAAQIRRNRQVRKSN